jgi:hypothetical protein
MRRGTSASLVCVASGLLLLGVVRAEDKAQAPKVQIPDPGVPQIMSIEGRFVRVAYNNEGYVILGYRLANQSVGQPWMLLEMGTTLREKVPTYTLTRDAVSIETPDGKTIPLATVEQFRKADLRALENQASVVRDSINYFPPLASEACRIGFFAELDQPGMAYDRVELHPTRACLGRLYFEVPGGIQYGQHWLNVKFHDTLVRAPFRILTKDEEKLLSKNFKSIRKQVKEAFEPK